MCKNPIDILLVEDDPGDVILTKEALNDNKININLSVVEDGLEALLYLHKEGQYMSVSEPDLILLDLNLPKKDGRELLKDIKSDMQLKQIPVIILTTSEADEDIIKSYKLHANCYITKPVDWDTFIKTIKSIEEFWFSVVKLPGRFSNV